MKQLLILINKAKRSSFYLWLLNVALLRLVPFNKPHKFKVLKIDDNSIEINMPYRKANLNHIKGLHACGLATVAEYTTGLFLLSQLDPKKYRLVMQSMEITYHYQGKYDAIAKWRLNKDWLQQKIFSPLQGEDSIIISPKIEVHDTQQNHLCTATINWQIKHWVKVQTKV